MREPGYPFVPYPVELAELERRGLLSRTKLRILALRRFADALTGEWAATTEEIARLIGSGRSTAQKALRALEQAGYLHLRHLRGRTVRLVVSFGGFPDPCYRRRGKPSLYWDREFVDRCVCPSQSYRQGKSDAGQTLNEDRLRTPDGTLVLKLAHSHVLNVLGKAGVHLRVNVIMPMPGERLKVVYSYNMDNDADRRLELGLGSGAAGHCWLSRAPVVCDLEDARTSFATKWRMGPAEQARVRPSLRSLLSMPIFEEASDDPATPVAENRLRGVLNFDSDEDLLQDFQRPALQQAAAESAAVAGRYLTWSQYTVCGSSAA